MTRANTPGPLGYLVAVVVAILVTDTGFIGWQAVPDLSSLRGSELFQALFVWCYAGVYVAVLATPTALVGVPVVHLLCRRHPQQVVHVVVAGLVGAVAGGLWAAVLQGVDGMTHAWWLVVLVGLACAAGRAAVVPMRRRQPVEDDSRRAVPAC